MSKERLEEFSRLPFIKRIELTKKSIQKDLEEHDYHFPKNVNINTQYVLEIIEQAERVQELERSNKMLDGNFKTVKQQSDLQEKINLKLIGENRRYRDFLNRIHDTDDIVEVYDIVDEYKTLEDEE